jgi:hypothetical protein
MVSAGAMEKAGARMQAAVSASRAGLVQTAAWQRMHQMQHVLVTRLAMAQTAADLATCIPGQRETKRQCLFCLCRDGSSLLLVDP